MYNRPFTLFIDIDGTLIRHCGDITEQPLLRPDVLPGVKEKLQEWDRKGYNIILTTGRRESMRAETEAQLAEAGIFYDMLIMGIGGGTRVVINDSKPNSDEDTAIGITVKRNAGLEGVNI